MLGIAEFYFKRIKIKGKDNNSQSNKFQLAIVYCTFPFRFS